MTHLPDCDQQVKRKSDTLDCRAESNQWPAEPGSLDVVASPLQTPVSAKALKGSKGPKNGRNNRLGPQTPVSNAGSS